MSDSPKFHLGMFKKHVGERFTLKLDEADRTLDLVEAVGKLGQLDDDSRNFALLFNDPESSVHSFLPQAIYQLDHESLGELQIFLVPVGPGSEQKGIDYEAVFASPY